jgi:hypothetical protein
LGVEVGLYLSVSFDLFSLFLSLSLFYHLDFWGGGLCLKLDGGEVEQRGRVEWKVRGKGRKKDNEPIVAA